MRLAAGPEELALTLRVTEFRDLADVARLHADALPGGFFVTLGRRFLESYHRTFLTSPAGIALVAERGGSTVGFIVGAVDEEAHDRHVVRRDRWGLGIAGAIALARQPHQARRFVMTRLTRYARALVRLSQAPAGGAGTADVGGRAGVLSHMVVDATHRREGVGSVLLHAFTDTARAQGSHSLRLATAWENRSAQRFYERRGWRWQEDATDRDGHCWRHYGVGLR